MNSKLISTQLKRELWENKVGFLYTPLLFTALIAIVSIIAVLYVHGIVASNGVHINFSSQDMQSEQGVTLTGKMDSQGPSHPFNKADWISNMGRDINAFSGMVQGIMYANCAMLYLIFSIVLWGYALRCLFDDRKNRDILFWRSMPVSETTNVLVKLGFFLFAAPLVMMVLNLAITLMAVVLGSLFFVAQGISFSFLMSSIWHGASFYLPIQVCYELIFGMLMLLPIIGFAFFSSAFAKKSPFFIFASPALVLLADKILNSAFGLNIGAIDLAALYGKALINVSAAYVLQSPLRFNGTMVLPLLVCTGIGALLIAATIWLRNHRYEI